MVDEDEEYSKAGLAWVLLSVALMIVGIQVLLCKTSGKGSSKSHTNSDERNNAVVDSA